MTNYLKMKALELMLVLDLQYFAEGDDDLDGEGEQGQQEQQQQEQKTFTQEELNKIIAKEKKTAQESFLKSVGFEDFKNAKDGIAKFQEWQESQKTEAQKQVEALEAATKELETEKADKESLSAQLSALKQDADPEKLTDLIVLAKTRVTDEVTMDEAIKQTLELYPQFKKGTEQGEEKPVVPQYTPGSPNPPGGNKEMTRDSFAKMSYAKRVEFQQANPAAFKKLFE